MDKFKFMDICIKNKFYKILKLDFSDDKIKKHINDIIILCEINVPKINFIGIVEEYNGQYTKIAIEQNGIYSVQSIKKIKYRIKEKNNNYKIKNIILEKEMEDDIKKYLNDNLYKLKNIERFNGVHTIINIICNNGHEYQTTFNNIRNEHLCNFCRGPKSLSFDTIESKTKIVCDTIGYKFIGIKNKNGARSILDLRCDNNHIYNPLYYNFVNSEWRCGECHIQRKSSKKCIIIENFLIQNNIKYIKEHRFYDCRNKLPLPFDFYLPDYNLCIEYDGIQHFKPIKYWGGNEAFSKQNINDNIKNKYCNYNNIRLLRIKYTDIVDDIMISYFKEMKNG